MLKNVRLKLLPNTTNCLTWSPEGALAISAGEDVLILVPKFITPDGATKRPQQFWHARASMRELIIQQIDDEIVAAKAKLYSVGEEQGPGYAKEVVWSPLGGSRYLRCLLAVLATNHKTWIFEPVGHVGADVRPRYEVTRLMAEYDGFPPDDESVPGVHRKRLRSRCRAIAWSPPCRTERNRWGESLLAVSNEHLEIVLFRADREKAKAVGHVAHISHKDIGERLGKRVTHFSVLRWSPWRSAGEGKYCALLAYVLEGKAYASTIYLEAPVIDAAPKVGVHGGIVVGETISERHPIFSIAFAPEEICGRIVMAIGAQLCTTVVSFGANWEMATKEQFTHEFVEEIAGLSFAPCNDSNATIIQLITSLGKSQTITYTTPTAPLKPGEPSFTLHGRQDMGDADALNNELQTVTPTWPTILAEMKQDYMEEYEIPVATVRGYGLAVSPLGGLTAVAVSFHPKDSIQYITGNNEKTAIILSPAPGSVSSLMQLGIDSDQSLLPNPITMSTEAMLLECMALGAPSINSISSAINAVKKNRYDLQTISVLPEHIDASLAANVLQIPALNALRYEIALGLIPGKFDAKASIARENPSIIAAAIVSLLSVPRDAVLMSNLSKRILYSFACVGIMGLHHSHHILNLAKSAFEWLDNQTPPDVRFDLELGIIRMRLNGETPQLPVENGFVSSMETCRICQEGMVWRDLRIANCVAGHRFSRCALTFLPIVDPAVTRECAVCGRTALGYDVAENDEREEGRRTLVDCVFAAWEICLQCGGRYWAERS